MPSRESLVQMAIWKPSLLKLQQVLANDNNIFSEFVSIHLDILSLEVFKQGSEVSGGLDAEVLGRVAPGGIHSRLSLGSAESLEKVH